MAAALASADQAMRSLRSMPSAENSKAAGEAVAALRATTTEHLDHEEAELEPFYARAEDKLGVTGTADIPRLPGNNNFKVMAAGAKRLGYKEVHTGNMAINSQPRDGRPACQQIGFCMSGCAIGAKWSTLYAEIPKAESTGHFELRPDSMVVKINHDSSGKVTGVVYADKAGALQEQRARVVCVAGNSVEKHLRSTTSYSVRVHMEDGKTRYFTYEAAPPFHDGERVLIELLGLTIAAQGPAINRGEVIERIHQVRMVGAYRLFHDREAPPEERLGVRMAIPDYIDARELFEPRAHLRVVRTQRFLANGKRALAQRLDLVIAALFQVELSQSV